MQQNWKPGFSKSSADNVTFAQAQAANQLAPVLQSINVYKPQLDASGQPVLGSNGQPVMSQDLDYDATKLARQKEAMAYGMTSPDVLNAVMDKNYQEAPDPVSAFLKSKDPDEVQDAKAVQGIKGLFDAAAYSNARADLLEKAGVDPDSDVYQSAMRGADFKTAPDAMVDQGDDSTPMDSRHDLNTKDLIGAGVGLAIAGLSHPTPFAPSQAAQFTQSYLDSREADANALDQDDQQQYQRDVASFGTASNAYLQQAQQADALAQQHYGNANTLGQRLLQVEGLDQSATSAAQANARLNSAQGIQAGLTQSEINKNNTLDQEANDRRSTALIAASNTGNKQVHDGFIAAQKMDADTPEAIKAGVGVKRLFLKHLFQESHVSISSAALDRMAAEQPSAASKNIASAGQSNAKTEQTRQFTPVQVNLMRARAGQAYAAAANAGSLVHSRGAKIGNDAIQIQLNALKAANDADLKYAHEYDLKYAGGTPAPENEASQYETSLSNIKTRTAQIQGLAPSAGVKGPIRSRNNKPMKVKMNPDGSFSPAGAGPPWLMPPGG